MPPTNSTPIFMEPFNHWRPRGTFSNTIRGNYSLESSNYFLCLAVYNTPKRHRYLLSTGVAPANAITRPIWHNGALHDLHARMRYYYYRALDFPTARGVVQTTQAKLLGRYPLSDICGSVGRTGRLAHPSPFSWPDSANHFGGHAKRLSTSYGSGLPVKLTLAHWQASWNSRRWHVLLRPLLSKSTLELLTLTCVDRPAQSRMATLP
jgi:rRNA maturation protein Nop10